MIDRPGNNLPEWYEIVKDLVDTPLTVIWQHDRHLTSEDYPAEIEPVADALKTMWRMVGTGYPAFMRSGLTSGKHQWRKTCYVAGEQYLSGSIRAICEYSELADMFGLPTDTWVLRELLKTEAPFTAFEGMPITKERRYFVIDDRVVGHHPYWPPEAIEVAYEPMWDPTQPEKMHRASTNNWRIPLERLNRERPEEIAFLTQQTERVGAAVTGAWSVDWLWAQERWWLTDMAHAEESFVWWDHPSAPKQGAW